MSADTQTQPRRLARHRLRPAIALLAIPAAAVVLAACGGSSGGGNSTATSTAKDASARSSRFASLRSCLQKEGINLSAAPSGGTGQPGGGGTPSGGAGGFKLPEGVSRSKFEEAIKKCGGGGFAGGARPGLSSSTARAALTKYAACMRENGVNLPAPNTSGKGPVFNTKGINTSSETFKTAQKKCQSDLKGAFGAGGSRGEQPPASEGGPPAGGYGPPPGSEGENG